MNKNILNLLLVSFFFIAFTACKKEENRVIYNGGTAPVLTASTTGPIVLDKTNNQVNVLSLNWTNPDYLFNTGVSSQNVTYILQIDTAGKNFTSPKLLETSFSNDLGVVLTAKQLNSYLSRMELKAGLLQTVDMRIKATLTNGSVPLTSNSVSVKVNPYLDFAVEPPGTPANNYEDGNLWIVGGSVPSGWPGGDNVLPAPFRTSQKFEKIDALHYKITLDFVGGGGAKLLQTINADGTVVWSTQYHALDGSASAALSGDFAKGDTDPQFPGPPAGKYEMVVNFQTGKYTLTKK